MEATKTRKRQRLTTGERQAMQSEALDRAEHGRTCANDLLIVAAYAARGIEASPRIDCFTFNAWRALNRHVKKGEHGVHVPVYIRVTDQDKQDPEKIHVRTIPTGATVFHISQTDPDETKTPITLPLTPQEADTLDNIEATQRQDADADEREQAEDDHEAAILDEEQRENERWTRTAPPATTAKSTTTDAQPVLF